jgi:hypothetical protein
MNSRYAMIGLAGGVFGGLVGLGGGVLLVPLLTVWAGLGQHQAAATSLTAVLATGLMGTVVYGLSNALDWWAALWVMLAAVVTTPLAVRRARHVPASTLRQVFAWFLLLMAASLFFKDAIPALPLRTPLTELALLVTGVMVGGISGFLGIGGGALLVPALVFTLGLEQHTAQGTSLLAMIPASVFGTLVNFRLGHVQRPALLVLVPAVLVGTLLGGRLALLLPVDTLRLVFAFTLVVLAMQLLTAKVMTATKGP